MKEQVTSIKIDSKLAPKPGEKIYFIYLSGVLVVNTYIRIKITVSFL